MKIELSGIKNFKDVLTNVEYFLEEVKFEVDSDGLRFRGLDKSHIAFIGLYVDKEYFDVFNVAEPTSCIVDTGELVRVLKRAKNNDTMVLSWDTDNFKLQFYNDDLKRNFKIRQVDMEYSSPAMPKIEYPVSFDVNYKLLIDSVKDAELYSDKVKLRTNEYSLFVETDGDYGDYKSELSILENLKQVSSIFSIAWLNKIFKVTGLSENIHIDMGNDMPLFVELDDGLGLKANFLIAPRIEDFD